MSGIDTQLIREQQAQMRAMVVDLSRTVGEIANLPKHMKDSLERMAKDITIKNATAEYERELKKVIKGESQAAQERRRILMENYKLEQDLLKGKQHLEAKYDNARKKYTEATEEAEKAQINNTAATIALSRAAEEHSRVLTEASATQFENAKKAQEKASEIYEQKVKAEQDLAATSRELEQELIQMNGAVKKVGDNMKAFTTESSQFRVLFRENITQSGKHLAKSLIDTAASLFSFTNGVKLLYNGTKQLITTGIDINALQEPHLNIMGMSTAEYADFSKKNRAIVLAQGGTAKSIDNLRQASSMFASTLPDLAERNKFLAASMNNLMNAGITPTATNMKIFAQGWEQARKNTNLSAEEYASFMDDQMNNEYVRFQLRTAASDKERAAVIDGINKRLNENSLMGRSIELQKKQMAQTAAELGGPVKDRFKKSFLMQQSAAMMGMSKDDVRKIGEYTRKGKHNLDATQLDEYNELMNKMAGKTAAAYASGNLGKQLGVDYFSNATGSEALNVDTAVYNQPAVAAAKGAEKSLGEVSEESKKLINSFEALNNVIQKNPWLQMGMGAGVKGVESMTGGKASGIFDFIGKGATVAAGAKIAGSVLAGTSATTAGAGTVAAGTGAAASGGMLAAAAPIAVAAGTLAATMGVMKMSGLDRKGADMIQSWGWYDKLTDPTQSAAFKEKQAKMEQEAREKYRKNHPPVSTIKDKELSDPSKMIEKSNADRLEKIATNSDYLPKILDVAEKSLAVAVSSVSTKRGEMNKLLKSGASSQSWTNLITQ